MNPINPQMFAQPFQANGPIVYGAAQQPSYSAPVNYGSGYVNQANYLAPQQYGVMASYDNGGWQNQGGQHWTGVIDTSVMPNEYQPVQYTNDTNAYTVQDYQFSEPITQPEPTFVPYPVYVQPQILYVNYSPINITLNGTQEELNSLADIPPRVMRPRPMMNHRMPAVLPFPTGALPPMMNHQAGPQVPGSSQFCPKDAAFPTPMKRHRLPSKAASMSRPRRTRMPKQDSHFTSIAFQMSSSNQSEFRGLMFQRPSMSA